MFNPGFDEMFFTTHFVSGLKEDIRLVVQTHLPDSVDRVALLAKIQQQNLDRSSSKCSKWGYVKANNVNNDKAQNSATSPLWRERHIRDYRKANDLCYYFGEKFVPGHLQKCSKKVKPQLNALIVSDLDVELTGETLNHLAVEDVLTEEMGPLSLNAMAGTKVGNSMRLKALVRDKVILIFIESGSPHSCESVLCVPCWFEHNWGYSNTGQGG
jgi:hypothetical protein